MKTAQRFKEDINYYFWHLMTQWMIVCIKNGFQSCNSACFENADVSPQQAFGSNFSIEGDTLVKNDLHICTFAFFSQVATKEMKKKKQKHRIKEIEKRSSEKEMDMMDAYTDKPVQEQVSS